MFFLIIIIVWRLIEGYNTLNLKDLLDTDSDVKNTFRHLL